MYKGKMTGGSFFLVVLILALIWFFGLSALIMVTYNNSLVKMNDNYKPIDYNTSMIFVLFLTFLSMTFVSCNRGCNNLNYKF